MPGFQPGAFVSGHQAGTAQALKEEANKRAQQIQGQQLMRNELSNDLVTQQVQKLKDENDAYKQTVNSSFAAQGKNIIKNWNPENPQQSLDQLNTLPNVAKKGQMKLADDNQILNYLTTKELYKPAYYVVEPGADGKGEQYIEYTPEQLERLANRGTDEAQKILQQVQVNIERDQKSAIDSYRPYVVVGTDGKSVVSVEDIAPIIGAEIPPSLQEMYKKKAGLTPRSSNKSRYQLMEEFMQANPNATPEEIDTYAKSITGKYGDGGDDTFGSGSFSWQAKASQLSKILEKESRGEKLTPSEQATKMVLGGSKEVSEYTEAGEVVTAKDRGENIVQSKQGGLYTFKDEQAAKRDEATLITQDRDLKKAVTNFTERTNNVQAILDMKETLRDAVTNGIRVDVIGESLASIQKMGPDEVASLYDMNTLETKLKIKGQEAMIVGQMVKALYGSNSSNRDREAVEGAYSKKFFDNTATAEAKVNNLLDFVSTAYTRTGESLVKRGATYTPVKEMNDVTTRMGSLETPKTSYGTKSDYESKSTKVIFKAKGDKFFKFDESGKPYEVNQNGEKVK